MKYELKEQAAKNKYDSILERLKYRLEERHQLCKKCKSSTCYEIKKHDVEYINNEVEQRITK